MPELPKIQKNLKDDKVELAKQQSVQIYDSVFSGSFANKVKNYENYDKRLDDIKSQLPNISSFTNDSPLDDINIVINRKNIMKL